MLALALAACGDGADAPAADATRAAAVAPAPTQTPIGPERHILAFGDSLFAGYGLDDGQSYPARLQAALREQGINALVTNAGVSGDTSAAALQRLDFVLDGLAPEPDLAIVELGGNDLLRGLPPATTRANIEAILAALESRNIPVLLMGMRAPPNLGEAYVEAFDAIYPDLAKRYGAHLVPFFLAPVYDKPALIQADRVHPTAEGIEAIVDATVGTVAAALPQAG
jgi:acyl-CoA thioesterase-1